MQKPAPVLVYLRPTRLVYVRGIGTYESTIPAVWNRLVAWLDAHGLKNQVGRSYGLAHDDPARAGGENCRYDACVAPPTTMEPSTLSEIGLTMLPGGPYACQRVEGDFDDLRGMIATAHSNAVPFEGLTIDPARPVVSIYMDTPARSRGGDLRADICLPVMAMDGSAAHPEREFVA